MQASGLDYCIIPSLKRLKAMKHLHITQLLTEMKNMCQGNQDIARLFFVQKEQEYHFTHSNQEFAVALDEGAMHAKSHEKHLSIIKDMTLSPWRANLQQHEQMGRDSNADLCRIIK